MLVGWHKPLVKKVCMYSFFTGLNCMQTTVNVSMCQCLHTVGYHCMVSIRSSQFNTILNKYKSNSQMIKQLGKELGWEEGKEKIFWQLTHYLCRYPPVASSFPLSLFLSLSICQWRDKIPLSWRLNRDYPSVPGESRRGAEMPHYRCSKR